ncbi:MAG: MarR family transcriptional regulator [Chitinophagaceae bacterium]|nr:MarR family transcriptional regulator [Chitinophagaceae bacterium]
MHHSSLEKLIKLSTPFVNPYYKAVVGILYLETLIMQDLDKYLARYKLTYQQFNILRILKGQYPKGVKLSLLQERMLHKQSDVSRLVNRLVKTGMVDKKEDELNKRRLYITLSEQGLTMINAIDVDSDLFKSVMVELNISEIEHLNRLFDKILQAQVK